MKAKNATIGTRVVVKDLAKKHSFFYLEGAKGKTGTVIDINTFADGEVVSVKFDNFSSDSRMWGKERNCWNIPVEYLRLEK